MAARDAKKTLLSTSEEDSPLYFSEWLKRRRQELDLTQEQLAKRASCSVFAIRKIEMGERRPSRQLAGLLAQSLEISPEHQATFIKVARGELAVERLAFPVRDNKSPQKPDASPGNLPRALTPFIGREPELGMLAQLLHDPQCSLLTIVGPGGIGKSRLAIEAACHSADLFPEGSWFVPLASLHAPTLIVPAMADALRFKFQEPSNLQGQLIHYLRNKRALLVLDNAEHLLEGVGIFTEILKECQQVKLLVTSRERLNLLSEWVIEIQGLPVPADDQVEQFEAYSSVALFVQSARRVQAGYEIREGERRWILKICQVVEGMPLGIELSAAWVGILSCETIAREIEGNLDFLSASLRDLPERHRSLRATLDHSWNLLSSEEKQILSRLAVFRGSFSRAAAREICGASLAVLSSLRNKCLLNRTDNEFYGLHEIIRQYAGQKLAEQPEELERVNNQHAAYFVQCLANWEADLQSSRQLETLNEIARIVDDLSHAWRHMITNCRPGSGLPNKSCAEMILSSMFSLSMFYEERCRSLEAIDLFKGAVETLTAVQVEYSDTTESANFESILGLVSAYLGWHLIFVHKNDEAREYLEDAVKRLEICQPIIVKAQAQLMLSEIQYIQGQLQKSADLQQECREVFREKGEEWWYLLSTIRLASILVTLGRHQEAKVLFQEGFRLIKPGDLRLELRLRYGYASVLFFENEYALAEPLMHENLQLSYDLGNDRLTAFILFDLGRIALATQRIEQAVDFHQRSINLLSAFGESHELALVHLFLGKCFVTNADLPSARDQFRQAMRTGQILDLFYLIHWALVNIARTYVSEGQAEKMLEIALTLRRCPPELKRIQDDSDRLLAELQAALPVEQIEFVKKQVEARVPADQARVSVLAYAQEYLNGLVPVR